MSEVVAQELIENKANVITRSEATTSRSIEVLSPISGKKQIVDFGFNIKNLNLMVYTTNVEDFNEDDYINVFSEEFVGQAKAENVTISQYSSIPYSIVSISAIGEDSASETQIELADGIHTLRGLDDYYSVNYRTTYISNIGTGFNISIASKYDITSPEIKFTYDDKPYTLGNQASRLIGKGKNVSRTMSSYTNSFGDPLSLIIQKTVIISTISRENSEFINAIGDTNNDKIVFWTKEDFYHVITTTIGKGDVAAFVKSMIGNELNIVGDKQTKSAIVKILQEGNSEVYGNFVNVFYNNISEQWLNGGIFSVGTILAQILPMFGLELYFNGSEYSLEPPRFMFYDGDTISNVEISYDDVSSITMEEPKINIPSVIIPQIDFKNMALSSIATKCSEVFVSQVVKALSQIKDLPVFKIEVYEVPNLLVPEYLEENKKVLFSKIDSNFSKIWKYYSSFAFKTFFQNMHTGTIELTFRPDITEPYKWYKIGDESYFVTEINHTIQRGSVNTTLSYSGRYDDKLYNIIDEIMNSVATGKIDCGEAVKRELNNKNVKTPLNVKDAPKTQKPDLTKKVEPVK